MDISIRGDALVIVELPGITFEVTRQRSEMIHAENQIGTRAPGAEMAGPQWKR
jgi:hypothetical protein